MARARGVNPRRDGCDRRPSLPRRDRPLKRCVEYEEGVEATLPSDHVTSCPGPLETLRSDKYKRLFVWRRWRHIDIEPIELAWRPDTPCGHSLPPRPCPPAKREAATRQINKYVDQGFLEVAPIDTPYTSPTVLVWKKAPAGESSFTTKP